MDKFDRIGARGIDEIMPLLETIAHDGIVRTVAGSSLETDLQRVGVDLVLWQDEHQLLTLEVKTSEASKPDFFVETVTDIITARPGWLHKLRIDWFAHVSLASHYARLFRWTEFKAWFNEEFKSYRKKAVFQIDYKKTAVGLWIPWEIVEMGLGKKHFGLFDLGRPDMWNDKLIDMNLK